MITVCGCVCVLSSGYTNRPLHDDDVENHRTDTAYEDALIAKTFLFQFVNSYASCFYIAFIKNYIPGEACEVDRTGDPNCMSELSSTLGIILLTRIITGNLKEIVVPYLKHKVAAARRGGREVGAPAAKKKKKHSKVVGSKKRTTRDDISRKRNSTKSPQPAAVAGTTSSHTRMSKAEEQYRLAKYDHMSIFADYSEMAILFGYSTLFVVAFPLAPALAFVNNYIEIRVDGYKLSQECRRAEPNSAEDIGTWFSILEIMASISVLTNIALIVFTSVKATEGMSELGRVWIFLILEHSILCLKFLLSVLVEDTPEDVEIQHARAKYLVDKIFHLHADREDDRGIVDALSNNIDIDNNPSGGGFLLRSIQHEFIVLEQDPNLEVTR